MKPKKFLIWIFLIGLLLVVMRLLALPALGGYLIDTPTGGKVDAAVVLNTGVDYYPRLMEAAAQYREGRAPLVVINGNRKSDALRELEAMGYEAPASWYEGRTRMLEVLGVPRDKVISISAEDAFDTISEAMSIAPTLEQHGLRRLLIVTSPFHSRRAAQIWRNRLAQDFIIDTAPARRDPFDPQGWWRDGRQIRQLMAEYGGWAFYYWSLWREPPIPAINLNS